MTFHMRKKRTFAKKLAAAFFIGILLAGCAPENESIRTAIAVQMEEYPESRVQDIYKSFCQDAFGPGHLIPDAEGARRYLESELEEYAGELASGVSERPAKFLVPTGDAANFYRVDLSVVLDSLVSEEEYLAAFIESANAVQAPSAEEWTAKWESIKTVLLNDFRHIPDAGADIRMLDSLVAAGHYIIHHSDAFGTAYHPHYRIIARDKVKAWQYFPHK